MSIDVQPILLDRYTPLRVMYNDGHVLFVVPDFAYEFVPRADGTLFPVDDKVYCYRFEPLDSRVGEGLCLLRPAKGMRSVEVIPRLPVECEYEIDSVESFSHTARSRYG